MHTPMHTHTHTHSNTQTYTHTQITHTHRYTHTHTHVHTQTHTHTFFLSDMHTHTHTPTHMHTPTHTHEQLLTSPLMGLVVTQVPVKHCQERMHAPIAPSMQAIAPLAPLSCCRTPQWDVSVTGKTRCVYAETRQCASLSNWLMTGTSVDWMVTQDPHHLLHRPGKHLPWILVRSTLRSEAASYGETLQSASLSNSPLTGTSVEWVDT